MAKKYSHQLLTGISFGLTSAVITSLGMIVGLNSATSSRLAVGAGIIVMAVADGLADAMGLHLAEESEIENGKVKHTSKEVWLTTAVTFFSVSGFCSTFAIPILLFPMKLAVFLAISWGILLLVILNFYIARIKKERPLKLILQHILLAIFVIAISYEIGNLIKGKF
ncbi:hypothetical protein J7J45_05885 [Candidatus Aerophobetes bacterium]|nr:hypothetical protein [Candidatus Aerophobetes bacterium]